MATIDLNADLGEGFGPWRMTDDDGLLDVVTSANVACGFHAGDPSTMLRVCERAAERDVAVGAHLGYRDLLGFGRRELPTPPEELHVEALYQLGALDALARRAGTSVRYVKPHGALYHAATARAEVAAALVGAVTAYDPALALLGAAGGELEREAARAGLTFVAEGFADRAYDGAGRLVPRDRPGAVHDRTETMLEQVRQIALTQSVTSTGGTTVPVSVASLCVHGDTPGAVEAARAARRTLEQAGVQVRAFAKQIVRTGANPPQG